MHDKTVYNSMYFNVTAVNHDPVIYDYQLQ